MVREGFGVHLFFAHLWVILTTRQAFKEEHRVREAITLSKQVEHPCTQEEKKSLGSLRRLGAESHHSTQMIQHLMLHRLLHVEKASPPQKIQHQVHGSFVHPLKIPHVAAAQSQMRRT